jgi:CRP-like cAMP-binding protein/Fe-S-cluster-containing hydrogenase component 2
MALLESAEDRRPSFAPPAGSQARRITLSDEQKLEYLSRLELVRDLLDAAYETRPGAGKPIKVKVRDALLEHGEFWEIPSGTVIYSEGSFGEHLYLCLRGKVATTTSFALDVERTACVPIEEIGEGAFFGEHSVLSMGAHLSSAAMIVPGLLLLVPQFIVQELASAQESFRNRLMGDYVSRLVRVLVRRLPTLRSASDAEFDRLLGKARTAAFEVGEVIFEEGEAPDDVYVISDGFVKITKRVDGAPKVLGYLVDGDCFGDTGVLTGDPRGATAIAIGRVEALVLPGAEFRAIVDANPAAAAEAGALDAMRRLDADLVKDVTFVGKRLEFQAEVMPNLDVIVIDENLCVRCDNCVKACAAAHEYGFSRLIRKGVTFQEFLLPTACRFCQDPGCLLCKSGGIKRDKDGDIYFTDSCIGCSGCAQRCPYGNITMVETAEIGRPPITSLLDLVRGGERRGPPVPEASDKRPKLKKIPIKCDLDKEHLYPACVNNCPTGAIGRYRADELDRILATRA